MINDRDCSYIKGHNCWNYYRRQTFET